MFWLRSNCCGKSEKIPQLPPILEKKEVNIMTNALSGSDIDLLARLRNNARVKMTHLSRDANMPVSTIFERMRGPLSKCVLKYTCVLKNTELGFNSRATIILKVDKEQKKEIGQFLEKHQNVNSLYKINNGYDFMMDAIFRQMADLEEFIEQLERKYRIKHKEVYFIIDEIKQETFLSDPQNAHFLVGEGTEKPARKAAKR